MQEPLVQEPLVQESYPQLEPTLAREPLEQAMENPRVRTSAPGEVLVCNDTNYVPPLGSETRVGQRPECQPYTAMRFCACNSLFQRPRSSLERELRRVSPRETHRLRLTVRLARPALVQLIQPPRVRWRWRKGQHPNPRSVQCVRASAPLCRQLASVLVSGMRGPWG